MLPKHGFAVGGNRYAARSHPLISRGIRGFASGSRWVRLPGHDGESSGTACLTYTYTLQETWLSVTLNTAC